jgi:ABC-type transport system involved in Fe-S cluster assembly fused permease/ATPase subunit
MEQIMLYDTVH